MDFKIHFGFILKKLWFIILFSIVVGVITGYLNYSVFMPEFKACTTLLITGLSNDVNTETSTMSFEDIAAGQVLISEYSAIISSKRVTGAVVKELNDPNIVEADIRNMLDISAVNDTRIIEISIKYHDPKKAAQIADIVAEVFSEVIVELYRIENVDIIDKAEIPIIPVAPAKNRNIVLAVLVAVMFAVGVVFLLDFLNTKIRTSDDVEKHLGLSVIGSIPINVLGKEKSK